MGEERWKEFVEECRKKDAENSKNSEASQYALLDKTFPGGAVAAHRALARVLERDRRKKEKEAFDVRNRRKKLIWDVVAAYHPRADADGKPSEEKENCVRYTGSQYVRSGVVTRQRRTNVIRGRLAQTTDQIKNYNFELECVFSIIDN
jgi:hypothetical protein